MALGLDLVELARHLKQERLYVTSEREQVQNLYEEVKKVGEELYHESWISRQQKAILDALILYTKEVTPSECCARTNHLESSNFVDGYKYLSYHDSKFGELFKFLRENPVFLGHLFAAAEKANMESTINMIKVVMTSVYGSCVIQVDEIYALQMLKCLLELQLNTSDDPRRLVRRGSCAFSVAFKQLFDSVFSAKLFLTAALHDPVMRLLMEDEWFYDIDPGKALIRFPPQERLRRFGDSGTEEYKHKLQSYRKTIVEKLVYMASRFISSLKNNMHCFPPGLGWLVSQVYQVLTKNSKLEIAEVRAICTDLVFALFICPAICDPEPYGITTDVPISHIARHNLMQMAQIVQVLAISQWEEIDSKVHDLYSKFEKNCMSSLLDSLLDGLCPELPSTQSTQLPCLFRCSVLISLPELSNLVVFLRNAFSVVDEALPERKLLEDLLGTLPTLPLTPPTPVNSILNMSPSMTPKPTPPGTPVIQKKRKKKSIVSLTTDELHSAAQPTPDLEPQAPNFTDEVLVVSLGNDTECPGMLSEQKVISSEQENRRRRVKYIDVDSYDVGVGTTEIQEKRTRFSLSHDQESIGNTSDIQEAISEAASTHSVASIDLENDNDNFSDMISANVSGRGSPNISGRDTPLSQAESIEGRPMTVPNLPETVQKRNREDVTERFGKFEIKAELESDEIKSTVSDTWSTDVLASDSEPPEQNQQVRLEEIAEEMGRHLTPEHIDMSETASDAWSTDVLASDIDDKQVARLSEFDQDDVGSVTEFGAALEEMDIEAGVRAPDEETPLASGGQSPTEEKLSAVGGFSIEGTTVTMGRQIPQIHTNMNNLPPACDSVFEDPVNDRIQGSITYDSNRLFVPPKKKQASFSPSLASQRLISNPVCLPDEYSQLEILHTNIADSINSGRRSSELVLQTGSQVVGTETGARPKEQKYPSYPLKKPKPKNEQGDNLGFDMKRTNNISLNGNEGVIGRYSADSGVMSGEIEGIPEVTYQISDLKLTEQQNLKLNENRFSASMAYFDPLSSENEVAGDLLEGAGSPNLQSFQDVINSENVNDNSSSQSTIHFEFPVSRLTNEISSKGSSSSSTNEEFVKGDNPVIKRRSSTDSSQSSGSGISKEDGSVDKSDRSSLDSSVQMTEDKEIGPEEDAGNSSSKKKGGLFKTFKNKFQKGMKKKGPKSDKEQQDLEDAVLGDKKPTVELNIVVTETSDDILAKYRKKSILTSTPTTEGLAAGGMTDKEKQQLAKEQEEDSVPLYDPNNLENCPAFLDAKRKLRMVLSTGDFQLGYGTSFFGIVPNSPRDMDHLRKENNDLVYLLRAQLSEAINLQNKATIAQLHEALRCVRQFDTDGCKKLVRSLQEDYQGRSSYVAYLVRCKQGLLTTFSHLQRLLSRIRREKEICNKYLTNVCLRFFMEFRERNVMAFISDFQKLTVSDEKTDFVEKFLLFLNDLMARDTIWQAANNTQIEDAQLAIERYIMSRIYTHAMYPNGDGDILRDQLYHQHIIKLNNVITPQHSYMRIPRMYHLECPWPAAQREIYMINAYKTPKDKIQCVVRCSTTIMNLLSMANEKSVPAADDFMPVLIYVIIKANPPCLLSTIQYVNSFYEKRLAGEEQYWWMQFSSAVEFIKTMDYSEC